MATYDGGVLTRVLTRGNGTVGTNITYMASAIRGIPAKISDKGHLVVRGEATISYADFEAINDTLEDADDRYANPRNLAAGTLALDKTNLDKVKEPTPSRAGRKRSIPARWAFPWTALSSPTTTRTTQRPAA